MSRFLSERFFSLSPYVPGEQPQDRSYVKLNTNESPFPPSPRVAERLSAFEAEKLNLYSDPTAKELADAIVEFFNNDLVRRGEKKFFTRENVITGNGSDEILAFIFQAFCDHNKGMACPEVGYGCYPVYCSVQGIPLVSVPMTEDLGVDVAGFEGIKENITIANPNAQTGLYLSVSDIKTLLSENRSRLVVVDEAYVDFGAESVAPLIREFDNLIVVRTLSKSRQLAGGRIGFALASQELISDLEMMKYSFNPYNLNRLSILAGTEAMRDEEYFDCTRKQIIEIREESKAILADMGFCVTDSLANFILAKKVGIGGKELYLALKEKGVLVRFLSDKKLSDYVRITIGSKEQMTLLYQKIREVLKEKNL